MNQNRENLDSNGDGEQETTKIDPESKVKSSWPEKLTSPSIQPPVIQEPPSVQQANVPKLHSKEKKAQGRRSAAAKRKLPSIPTAEELRLPSNQAKASTSVAHNSSIHSTTEEKAKPSAPKPQVEGPPGRPRSAAKQKLPSIPTAGELSLPINQANASTSMAHNSSNHLTTEEKSKPSAPKPQVEEPPTAKPPVRRILPKIVVVHPNIRLRPRRLLPMLPTIIEQTLPVLSEKDAGEEGVHSAINDVCQSLEAKKKDSSLPSGPSVVEQAHTSLQSVKKEALPRGTEELQIAKPRKKASKEDSKRRRKLSKGTQTDLQSAEEEVIPSLKNIKKEKLPEIPGKTVEHPLQKAPLAMNSKENQPRESHTLSIVYAERDPEQPVNKAVSGVKPPATVFSPSPQPSLEHALLRPSITRGTRKARPPLNLDQLFPKSPPARRIKPSFQSTNVELRNDQGAARQIQTNTKAKRLVPPANLNRKSSKPPAARRMEISPKATDVADGTSRQTQTKAEAKGLVPALNSEQIGPKPPAARQIKLSSKATNVESLGNIQREARQTQTKTEPQQLVPPLNSEQIRPKPPAARRIQLSRKFTDVELLGTIQGAARKTKTTAEPKRFVQPLNSEQILPKLPTTRRMKLSSQTRETLGSSKGTISQTRADALLGPQYTPEHNFPTNFATKSSKVSPQATEGGPLKSVPGTLPNTLTKSETLSNLQHTQDHNLPRTTTARPTNADLTVTDTDEVPRLSSQNKEAPPNEQPKPGTYAFLNLKRREFEALQRLEVIAKRCRAYGQPVGKYSRHHLTVKSVLPGIQSTKEEATLLKPHPPVANLTKKGLPSTRLTVKQPRPKVQAPFDRELMKLQPTVKQVLPSITSSNLHTLVKQPLPSFEPHEESNVQPTVKETERSSQSGHLPGF